MEIPDSCVLNLNGQPVTMATLHWLLNAMQGGTAIAVVNGCVTETGAEVMHRLELSVIAAHEARVRKAAGVL